MEQHADNTVQRNNEITLSHESIMHNIFNIRGEKVILDFHLASLYKVENRVLKQTVKRKRNRFPSDFMFELTKEEWTEVITICDNLPKGANLAPHLHSHSQSRD